MMNIRVMLSGLARARSSSIARFDNGVSSKLLTSLSYLNGIGGHAYELPFGIRAFSSKEVPPHIVLEMPALSPTMNQGNIAKWRKKEGEKINVGDVICEIETDKATLEFESLEEGYLAKILAPEGSKDVLVGQPIAVTVEEQDDVNSIPDNLPGKAETMEGKPTSDMGHKESPQKTSISRISPSAKILIAEYGLQASSLQASGPRGTLLKSDVLAAIKSGGGYKKTEATSHEKKATPAEPVSPTIHAPSMHAIGDHEDMQNSQIRKVIAKRLLESKQSTPHIYISSDVILDPVLAFRKELKEQHNVKVSVNDVIVKAVAIALRHVPEVNAYWNNEKQEAILCESVDISIAVATDKGLMTPIVRNADQKTITAISLEIKELAEKARNGKLVPNEFQGGTFSISNLGMYPVDNFCAIINPPQACILAVGRGNRVVEPQIDDNGTEKPVAFTKMNLTLSADNRVFDEYLGGKFLSALASNFMDIRRLLL